MAQSQQRDDKGASAPLRMDSAPSKRTHLRDRKVTITLSLPKALFSVCFSLFILVWVFIFGVMLGRGHNPEEVVPNLAKVMPSPTSPVPAPATDPMNEVLLPQDLKYHDTLKTAERPRPAPQSTSPAPEPPAPAKPQKPTTPAAKPQPAPAKPVVTAPRDEDQAVYNYLYQVAAFTNSAAAQTMQKKLQAGGLSARIGESKSGGTTWYRIMVSFKGKPEDTRALRTKLASHGISDIILRGKSPAN